MPMVRMSMLPPSVWLCIAACWASNAALAARSAAWLASWAADWVMSIGQSPSRGRCRGESGMHDRTVAGEHRAFDDLVCRIDVEPVFLFVDDQAQEVEQVPRVERR